MLFTSNYIDFNFGLGFLPISQFIEITKGSEESKTTTQIDEMYGKISLLKDVIIYGDITNQFETLKYFYLLLEKNGFIVSTFLKYEELNEKLLSAMVGYLVVYMKDSQIVNFFKSANFLSKGDKVIVDTGDIKLLRFVNKSILDKKAEFKVMFVSKSKEFLNEILANQIFNLIPVNEDFLKEKFGV